MSQGEGVLIASVLATVMLTGVWMSVHAYGLFRVAGQLSEVSKQAQLAWLLSLVGGFTGPCVLPMSVVGMILAALARRSEELNDPTRQATSTILLSGVIIAVMMSVLIAGLVVSEMLKP